MLTFLFILHNILLCEALFALLNVVWCYCWYCVNASIVDGTVYILKSFVVLFNMHNALV